MNPATGIRPLEQMDGEKEPTAVAHRRYRARILKISDPHDVHLLSLVEANRSLKPRRPNILLVMADDMGWTDLGSFGSEIDTPNLNTLAREGVKFTDFHTSMSCSPTRSMLMSGTGNHLAGLGNMGDLLVSGPGIKSGVQNDSFAYVWDIMPTILDFTGISHPDQFNNRKVERMRGKSLKAILTGKEDKVYGEDAFVVGEMLNGKWMRQGDYKAVAIAAP